jgi:hypothetical protein
MPVSTHRRQILEDAWIGDAVLGLYARLKILRGDGAVDSAKLERMTSNRFLAAIGEPGEVEAALGRVFEREGLEAAFAWIELNLLSVFDKQEQNRLRKAGIRNPPKRDAQLVARKTSA